MNDIKEDLLGKSTVNRRRAAINILKKNLDGFANELLFALKLESENKHLDTISELIKTIGFMGNEISKLYIKENYIDKGYLLRDSCSSFIRLDRKDLTDVSSIIEIILDNNFSKSEGVLEVLGYDKMIPSIENQDKIISLCWDLGKDRQKGITDPRYGLAAACAGWKSEKVNSFLLHCIESNDNPLIYVSQNSLKGKYVKLR